MPKRMQYVTDCGINADPEGDLVSYEDYKELLTYTEKLETAFKELYNYASFDWDTMPEASRRKFHELVLQTAECALSKD